MQGLQAAEQHECGTDLHTHRRGTAERTTCHLSAGQQETKPAVKQLAERRYTVSARDGVQIQTMLKAIENEETLNEVDPALIFAMERTFLSALNQAFYLMLLATGLCAINDTDKVPPGLGATVYAAAIVYAMISYATHCKRLNRLENRGTCTPFESKVWLGALCTLAVFVAVVDLLYIFVYPVLYRAKAVDVAEDPALNPDYWYDNKTCQIRREQKIAERFCMGQLSF